MLESWIMMELKKRMIKNSDFKLRTVQLIMLGIIIISSLIFLNSHSQILDMKDEVQVWGMAFTTKGIDWSPYMEQNSLLSFGYSLFLVPIITLFHSAGAVYKISIILNICFLCVAYILSLYVFYNMLPQVNKMKLTIISLFMALCPGLVIIKSLALPYLLIMVVFWMILALFISLFKKSESWKIVCIAFLLAFGVWIHALMIAVIIATIPFILLLVKRKIFTEYQAIFLGVIVLFLLAIGVIIEFLWNNRIYQDSGNIINSSLYTLFNSIIKAWDNGALVFVQSILGKIYALSLNTLLIFMPGVSYIIKYFNKKEWKDIENRFSLIIFYVSIITIMMILISTFYYMNDTGSDGIFNVQILQVIVTPIIILGLYNIVIMNRWKRNIACYFLSLLLLSIVLQESIKTLDYNNTNPYILGIFNIFMSSSNNNYYDQNNIILFIILIIVIICTVFYKCDLKKNIYLIFFKSLAVGLALISCLMLAGLMETNTIVSKNNYYQKSQAEITSLIKTADDNANIYYLKSGKSVDKDLPGIQFLLYDRQLDVINKNEMYKYNSIKQPYFLITATYSKDFYSLINKKDILDIAGGYSLFTEKNGVLIDPTVNELKNRMFNILDFEENQLKLAPGTYEMFIQLQVDINEWNGKGSIEIKSGNTTIGKEKILKEDIINNQVNLAVKFSNYKVMGNINIEATSPKGEKIKINNAIYHKISNKYTLAIDKPDSLNKMVQLLESEKKEEGEMQNICFVKGVLSEKYDLSFIQSIFSSYKFMIADDPDDVEADYFLFDINDRNILDYMDQYSMIYYNDYFVLMIKNSKKDFYNANIISEGKKINLENILTDEKGEKKYDKPIKFMSGNYIYSFELEKKINTVNTKKLGSIQIYNKDKMIAEKEIYNSEFDENGKSIFEVPIASKDKLTSLSYKIVSVNDSTLKCKPMSLEIVSNKFLVGYDSPDKLEDFSNVIKKTEKETKIHFVGNYSDKYLEATSIEYLEGLWPNKSIDILTIDDLKTQNDDSYLLLYNFNSSNLDIANNYTLIAQNGNYTLWVKNYSSLMINHLENDGKILTIDGKVPINILNTFDNNKKNMIENLSEGKYKLTLQVTKKNLEKDYQSLIRISSLKSDKQIESEIDDAIEESIDLGLMQESSKSDENIREEVRDGMNKEILYVTYDIEDKLFELSDSVIVNIDVDINDSTVKTLEANLYNVNCEIDLEWLWIQKIN